MQIEVRSLSKENLLKIKEIDKKFYQEEILNIEWYLARYSSKHKGIFLLDNNKVVGYLVSVPIKKELYEAIINGVLTNDLYINPSMFINDSNYNYISSCVLLEEYQNKGYGSQMMKKLFQNSKGQFCTLTISDKGYFLAKKFLNLKIKINDKVNVFEYLIS